MRKIMSMIVATFAAVALTAGSCGSPAPAQPSPSVTSTPTSDPTTRPPVEDPDPEVTQSARTNRVNPTEGGGIDGRGNIVPASWLAAPIVPVNKRVIEVVDRIKPRAWNVRKAVDWLDKYTGSDLRLVARCSGTAYRCITVRQGRVEAKLIGWSEDSTITIDTNKAKRSGWYRLDSRRTWLLIHELSHQHGLNHSAGRNIMNPYVDEYKLVLTRGQRARLSAR
jgi:hypothetical protein